MLRDVQCTCTYTYPGGKVRVISREALARGDIARDPTFSRQIPCLRLRLHGMARSDGITRDFACIYI